MLLVKYHIRNSEQQRTMAKLTAEENESLFNVTTGSMIAGSIGAIAAGIAGLAGIGVWVGMNYASGCLAMGMAVPAAYWTYLKVKAYVRQLLQRQLQ